MLCCLLNRIISYLRSTWKAPDQEGLIKAWREIEASFSLPHGSSTHGPFYGIVVAKNSP